MASSLTLGVFKASSIVIERILTEGVGSVCPCPASCEEPLVPRYVPSVDELVELQQALWWFNDQGNVTTTPTFCQEEKLIPHIARIADSLRPIRPLVGRTDGWPTKMKRALRSLVDWFDALVSRWGWGGVAEPEPGVSQYLQLCKDKAGRAFERPMVEAARSISELWDGKSPCPYDDMADDARKRGIKPTMSSVSEALSQFEIARRGHNVEPRIGRCYPEASYEEHQTFVAAFASFHYPMLHVAPERCARPRFDILISQPKAATSPPAPLPEDEEAPAAPTAGNVTPEAPAEDRLLFVPNDGSIWTLLKLMHKAERCEQHDRDDIPYPRRNERWDDRIEYYQRAMQAIPGYDRLLISYLQENPLGICKESVLGLIGKLHRFLKMPAHRLIRSTVDEVMDLHDSLLSEAANPLAQKDVQAAAVPASGSRSSGPRIPNRSRSAAREESVRFTKLS